MAWAIGVRRNAPQPEERCPDACARVDGRPGVAPHAPVTSHSTSPVAILSELVAFRTDAAAGFERPLADHLAVRLGRLGADEVTVVDVDRAEGKPSSYVYARFGAPRLLVNAHLDTVPPNADWSSDPFVPRIEGGRLYALGAADTKGAAAAILSALEEERPVDTGVLFSGDEEHTSVAMRGFLESPHARGIERAIVCEPTSLRVGTRHRGIGSFEVEVSGPGGHSSFADHLPSPIAMLSRLAVELDDWARARRGEGPPGFLGMCLNLARMDGGVAFNVIPAQGRLLVSLRPPPGADTGHIRRDLEALIARALPGGSVRFSRDNAPFQTRDLAAFAPLLGDLVATPLDLGYWTEAALLVEAGIDAVVIGPGDIAQAHGPDEWVSLEQLDAARSLFVRAFRATR